MRTVTQKQAWQNRVSNAQGHLIEGKIKKACLYYQVQGIADIDKTPEPFKVIKKLKNGTCLVRPTRDKAQPDFKGTLKNGTSIIFEVKSTMKESISRSALTENQVNVLQAYQLMGAQSFVCVSIQNEFFMIPWIMWRDMKLIYGRASLKQEDIQEYKVPYQNGIMFLHHILKAKEGK
jgi:recombination protein U